MQNAGNLKSLERLEVIRKLNGANREWVNDDLYRLLLRKDMYVLAYERLKSIPGNMTPGTDDETLDGFSEEEIGKIIAQMKDRATNAGPFVSRSYRRPTANSGDWVYRVRGTKSCKR